MTDRTLDALFQLLTRARDFLPLKALDEIEGAFKADKLRLTAHIRGGAVNYRDRGKVAPPEGLAVPVLYQAWRAGMIYLAIEDGHLVVKIRGGGLSGGIGGGYPLESITWLIDDWALVDELWPAVVALPKSKQKQRKRDSCAVAARELWPPDGKPPEEMSDQEVIVILGARVEARRKELNILGPGPSPTTLLRATGRRSD
jgi:hypothetical protein